jgi:hypothetical protein
MMVHGQPLVRIWHSALRCVAIGTVSVYGLWQVLWLGQGQLPPALFLAITGLPAPTTGGTHSVLCLLRGDWRGSLHHNAMAIPIAVLALGSVAWAVGQAFRRRRLHLPRGMGVAWVAVLALAWSIKLAQNALITWVPD